jgi:glutathione S-transferase
VADYFRTMANDTLKVLDAQLAGRTYLVGDKPTIADIACFGTIAHAEEANIDITAFPNVSAWRGRVQKLPGHRAPYDLLPQADVA